jgi:hypothetical protein
MNKNSKTKNQKLTVKDIRKLFEEIDYMTPYELSKLWTIIRGRKVHGPQMYKWVHANYYGLRVTHYSSSGVMLVGQKVLIGATIQFAAECNVLK